MTYNEWRDELKNNLLSVSDAERKRVLDYYGEAYADRREAGFTEREIIADFGAPYDAAQRILYENEDFTYAEPAKSSHFDDSGDRSCAERRSRCSERHETRRQEHEVRVVKRRDDYTWVFVLLCVIFAIPLFCLVMTMVGVTVSLCVAPFGVVIDGIARVCAGIGTAFTDLGSGFVSIGIGLIQTGVGIVLFPVCFWLVKLMWKLFRKVFRWIRSLFAGKEVA